MNSKQFIDIVNTAANLSQSAKLDKMQRELKQQGEIAAQSQKAFADITEAFEREQAEKQAEREEQERQQHMRDYIFEIKSELDEIITVDDCIAQGVRLYGLQKTLGDAGFSPKDFRELHDKEYAQITVSTLENAQAKLKGEMTEHDIADLGVVTDSLQMKLLIQEQREKLEQVLAAAEEAVASLAADEKKIRNPVVFLTAAKRPIMLFLGWGIITSVMFTQIHMDADSFVKYVPIVIAVWGGLGMLINGFRLLPALGQFISGLGKQQKEERLKEISEKRQLIWQEKEKFDQVEKELNDKIREQAEALQDVLDRRVAVADMFGQMNRGTEESK
jgi:hypothetical protein